MSSLFDFKLLKQKIFNHTDTNPASETYGCSDRRYWGWKLSDFPDLTLQYSAYPLSLLLDKDDAFEVAVLKSIIFFWAKNLKSDGSADQCFVNEKSIGPTLYSLNGIISAIKIQNSLFQPEELIYLKEKIILALRFATKNPEEYGFIANHIALFADTFILGWEFTGYREFLSQAEREILRVANSYTEGWFPEYETADPGYQTQCIHYLFNCSQRLEDNALLEMVLNSIEDFLSYFVFPDGSFSGLFAGRATELFYPYPFYALSEKSSLCSSIISTLFEENGGRSLVSWQTLDFENFIRLGTNYLLSSTVRNESRSAHLIQLPFQKDFETLFTKAGLLIISKPGYYLVMNIKRGGIFKAVAKDSAKSYEDSGYLLKERHKSYTTSFFSDGTNYSLKADWLRLEKSFRKMNNQRLTPFKIIVLRVLGLSFLRFGILNTIIKKIMVSVLLKSRKEKLGKLTREVIFYDDRFVVSDRFKCVKDTVLWMSRCVPFHMASSGYIYKKEKIEPGYSENYSLLAYNPIIKVVNFRKL